MPVIFVTVEEAGVHVPPVLRPEMVMKKGGFPWICAWI